MYMGGERGAVGEGAEHPCWEVSSGSWLAPVWGPGIGRAEVSRIFFSAGGHCRVSVLWCP